MNYCNLNLIEIDTSSKQIKYTQGTYNRYYYEFYIDNKYFKRTVRNVNEHLHILKNVVCYNEKK